MPEKLGRTRLGIPCPQCQGTTTVTDTRRTTVDDNLGASTRRRRQCDACGQRFTTYETVGKKVGSMFEEMQKIAAAMALANAEQGARLDRLNRLMKLV